MHIVTFKRVYSIGYIGSDPGGIQGTNISQSFVNLSLHKNKSNQRKDLPVGWGEGKIRWGYVMGPAFYRPPNRI